MLGRPAPGRRSRRLVPLRLAAALPSRGDVQVRGESQPLLPPALPSRDLAPAELSQARTLCTMRENCCLRRSYFSQTGTLWRCRSASSRFWRAGRFSVRETGRFLHNVPAREKSAPFRSLAARQNRRSEVRASQSISQAGTLFQQNSPEQGRYAGIGRVSPFQQPQPSQAGNLFHQNPPKQGRCAR